MFEIEVKARVEARTQLLKVLQVLGCSLAPPVEQVDSVYVGDPERFLETWKGKQVARIRAEMSGHRFTMKEHRTGFLDVREVEFSVEQPAEVERVLSALGFQKVIVVRKSRVETRYEGITICVDRVAELGDFVEVERLVDSADPEEVECELEAFVSKLGLGTVEFVREGYDVLLYRARRSPGLSAP